ncbi:type I restriction-modification system subunit M [Ruminococcus gauvreauii]|uniref:site-specific DNA-methyltransferase (adenine-specific) n=1 Tax=Ruminococcus gauvreauii TaxID=438033 RepID=A0ABY5VKK4_9FIRM|nr:class I SAM-dependent DNA methyltransferase [Ruminococcus gauvreauii]UWP60852.1 type I restriction-modification system subunit M [Ruminococcus gauvreauii]
MITGEIRNKIDRIWTDMWAGGITNPLTVIEQLTYLMFIRSLDEKDLEAEQFEAISGEKMPKIFPQDDEGQAMRWSKFKNRDPREIYEIVGQKVFPFIKAIGDNETEEQTAFSRYMKDAMFLFPEGKKQLLQKVVTALDELYEHDIKDKDMLGDLYEYMLGKLATAGQNGQFRTPKHIREMMVALVAPTPDDHICDPACGTAGFLVSSAEYIRKHFESDMTTEQWEHFAGKAFTGFDSDNTMLRISAMNLMLHSITNPDVDYRDSVSKQNEISSRYDVILANPPFTGTVDAESINDNLKAVCNTKKTELLFLALFIRMLKKGGRCACIVPDGVLFGTSKAHIAIRKELVENHHLRAVVSMPSGVFKPYAGVSTAVLVFTKTGAGGTDKVWFYDMKADGFSLDDKRSEITENDIPDILTRFTNLEGEADRARTEQSFFVNKEEIADNQYDLSINRYKEVVYEKVEYDAPSVILDRLATLNADIAAKTEELRGRINE